MKKILLLVILYVAQWSLSLGAPNVLLISIDDLNDWVGVLGGHPQAETPNIDRLAKRGTLFTNAHCQSPVCNPSRASMLIGRYPHTTGIYFLSPQLRQVPALKDAQTLPQHFEANGYQTMGVGKIFHGSNGLYFQEYKNSGGFGPRPKKKISQPHGHTLWTITEGYQRLSLDFLREAAERRVTAFLLEKARAVEGESEAA